MRRFVFRLERILEIRRYRERERELELATATARCVELQNAMADRVSRMTEQLRTRAPSREPSWVSSLTSSGDPVV